MKKILKVILSVIFIAITVASCDGDGNIFKKSPKQLWKTCISDKEITNFVYYTDRKSVV